MELHALFSATGQLVGYVDRRTGQRYTLPQVRAMRHSQRMGRPPQGARQPAVPAPRAPYDGNQVTAQVIGLFLGVVLMGFVPLWLVVLAKTMGMD